MVQNTHLLTETNNCGAKRPLRIYFLPLESAPMCLCERVLSLFLSAAKLLSLGEEMGWAGGSRSDRFREGGVGWMERWLEAAGVISGIAADGAALIFMSSQE